MTVLTGNVDVPILATNRLIRELAVFRKYGQPLAEVMSSESAEGKALMRQERRYIRLFASERFPVDTSRVTCIQLNAYVPSDQPLVKHSDHNYTVALTNHADFDATLAYIESTGASEVVTDCTRSKHADVLAFEIRSRLGLDARASSSTRRYEWGT